MAIEIEPEKKQGSSGNNILLAASIVFLVLSFGSYFYLNNFAIPRKTAQINNATATLASMSTEDIQAKENELTLAQKYINDFKILYENNPKTSKFFDSFQKWAHPKVVYSGLSLDVGNKKVTIKGTTDGFQSVMQQIALIQNEPSIQSFDISNIALGEQGGVTFDLSVILKPELFK